MLFHLQPASPRRLGRPGRSALFHVEHGRTVRALLATPLDTLAAVSPRTALFRPQFCDEPPRFAHGRTSDGRGCPEDGLDLTATAQPSRLADGRRWPQMAADGRRWPQMAADGRQPAQTAAVRPDLVVHARRVSRPAEACRIAPDVAVAEPAHPARRAWSCARATTSRMRFATRNRRGRPFQALHEWRRRAPSGRCWGHGRGDGDSTRCPDAPTVWRRVVCSGLPLGLYSPGHSGRLGLSPTGATPNNPQDRP
jgi:hypothetical protein